MPRPKTTSTAATASHELGTLRNRIPPTKTATPIRSSAQRTSKGRALYARRRPKVGAQAFGCPAKPAPYSGSGRAKAAAPPSSFHPVRLAKYMAQCGVASRRHAERLVTSGRVFVGGRRVTDPAHDVSETDEVTVEGKPISPQRHEYHLVHKPLGVVSTVHDPEGRPR